MIVRCLIAISLTFSLCWMAAPSHGQSTDPAHAQPARPGPGLGGEDKPANGPADQPGQIRFGLLNEGAKPGLPGKDRPGQSRPRTERMPLSGLLPAVLVPDLCVLKYRVSTTSPECQAFCDQGLGYFYSYVWLEATRSFETAVKHDPECAMAWWGLARSLERLGRRDEGTKALLKAGELRTRASYREGQLILASLQEKGQVPGVGDGEARKRMAIATIDSLIAVHDDDEEAWYYRAQLAGGQGLFGGQVSAVPYYKALLQVNPLHPGANHELVHFYENFRRPALGWLYAENYIKSSPGIPHPFHMQAHLATRIGRWNKTADRSARAVELERAYHKMQGVRPQEDQQYSHHLEILLISLIHDGRFGEARAIEKEMNAGGYKAWQPWFRLHLAERDWSECLKIAEQVGKFDKTQCSWMRALVYLKQGDSRRALSEIEVLQHAYAENKNDKRLEFRLWEAQGLYLAQTGSAEAGLKLLSRAVDRLKDDYGHHAWGNGAYYMEEWGVAALQAGKNEVAEEAYLEALAHDPGSVRAALGLQVMCERLGRSEEAQRYSDLARRCWARADSQRLEVELSALRSEQVGSTGTTSGNKTPIPH
jgi:tetratricopeptide (TPR) repeat protein